MRRSLARGTKTIRAAGSSSGAVTSTMAISLSRSSSTPPHAGGHIVDRLDQLDRVEGRDLAHYCQGAMFGLA